MSMQPIHLFFALMAVIGGMRMLVAVHPRGWMFGIPMLAVSLTYLWYRTGFLGLNRKVPR
jgi:uncharacterized membrane protein AbrB (regulator of aidB expression)